MKEICITKIYLEPNIQKKKILSKECQLQREFFEFSRPYYYLTGVCVVLVTLLSNIG